MINICKVTNFTKVVQTNTHKHHANNAWLGSIDVAGTSHVVILKEETQNRLIKELLAVELAGQFNVPHIQGWVASVDEIQIREWEIASAVADPNDSTRKLMFASNFSNGKPLADSGGIVDAAAKQRYFAQTGAIKILVFDELLGNIDRVDENIVEVNSQFYAFDHDKIFFGDTVSWDQLNSRAITPNSNCIMSHNVASSPPCTKSCAETLASTWKKGPIKILHDLIEAGLLFPDDGSNIESYLATRLKVLPSLVASHYICPC